MYVRIEDDNEAVCSIVVFETKQDVIDWLSIQYDHRPEVVAAFIKNNRLDGQDDEVGTYDYIEETKFWKK